MQSLQSLQAALLAKAVRYLRGKVGRCYLEEIEFIVVEDAIIVQVRHFKDSS